MKTFILCALTLLALIFMPHAQAQAYGGYNSAKYWGFGGWGWSDYDVSAHFENRFYQQQHHHRHQWSHSDEGASKSLTDSSALYHHMLEQRLIRNVSFNHQDQITYVYVGAPFHRLSYRDKEFLVAELDQYLFRKSPNHNTRGQARILRLVDDRGRRIIGTYSVYGLSLR